MPYHLKIFSGRSNRVLCQRICEFLNETPGSVEISDFQDGETYVQVKGNVRGADVFVIQPTSPPVNANLIEMLIMLDTFKRASAKRITAVLPYYGYARQDRKDKPRVAITSKLVAGLLESAGASRILTIDLHADQIQGFFDIPVDHLQAVPILVDYFLAKKIADPVIVSPDAGGVVRAKSFSNKLHASLAIALKKREEKDVSEFIDLIGEVKGKHAIILDDMIDTAGTLTQCAQALKDKGASKISAAATHPVLAGKAIERLENSCIDEVVVTDTIQTTPEMKKSKKIKVVSIAPLLGEAIKSIHEETSVSALFR